jgi:hypothetical protein
MAPRPNVNTLRSAGVATVAVFAAWAPTLSARGWLACAAGLGVALVVGLAVARRVFYPWLIGWLLLPFVSDPEGQDVLAVLQLGGGLLFVPRLHAFDVQAAPGARRFGLATWGWLVVAVVVNFSAEHWRATVSIGLVACALLGWLGWRARTQAPLLVDGPRPLVAIATGGITFAAALGCLMLSAALGPTAQALVARFRPPGADPAAVASPPVARVPSGRPRPPPFPPSMQGTPEADDDAAVQADTQAWCAKANRIGGMSHTLKPASLRWKQLSWRYADGDAAAACEIQSLIRRAVPEQGDCTNDNLYAANIQCEMREARDRKYPNGWP